METLLPLEEYEADPSFSQLSSVDKDKFYSNYYNVATEEAKSEDDYNTILKYKADRGKSAFQTEYQVMFPEDKQIDPVKVTGTTLEPLFNNLQSSYGQLDANQTATVKKFSADDMEDTSREFAYKPFQFGEKKGYSVKYPDGTLESISDVVDESQLTDFIRKNRLNKFNGNREGLIDGNNPMADTEFDSIYDKIRKTDAGLQGGWNSIRGRFASMMQGFDVKSIISDQTYVNLPIDFQQQYNENIKKLETITDPDEKDALNEKINRQAETAARMGAYTPEYKAQSISDNKELMEGLSVKYKDLAKEMQESEKIRGNRVLTQYQDHVMSQLKENRGRMSTFTDYFKENPQDFSPYLTAIAVSSVPDLAAIIGTASVTGIATGSPLAAGAAAGAVGFQMEYTGTLLSEMQTRAAEEGKNLYGEGVLAGYIEDTDFMRKTEEKAMVRAGIIGVADAVTGGASELIVQGIKGGLKRAGVALAVDAASGSGGEAAAEYATEGKLNWTEILNEGIGELSGAPMTVVRGAIQNKIDADKAIAAIPPLDRATTNATDSIAVATAEAQSSMAQKSRIIEIKEKYGIKTPAQSTETVPLDPNADVSGQTTVIKTDLAPIPTIVQSTPKAFNENLDKNLVEMNEEQAVAAAKGSFDRKDEGEKPKYSINGVQKGFNDKDEYVPMYQMVTINDPEHYFDGSTIMVPLTNGEVTPEVIEKAIEDKRGQEATDKARLAEMDEAGSVRYDSGRESTPTIQNQSQLTEKGPSLLFKAFDWYNTVMGNKPAMTEQGEAKIKAANLLQRSGTTATLFSTLSDTKSYNRVMSQAKASNYDESAQGRMMGLLGLAPNDSKRRVLTNVLGNFWTVNGNPKNQSPHMYDGLALSEAVDAAYRKEAGVDSIYDMDLGKLNEISKDDLFVAMAPDGAILDESGTPVYPVQSQAYTSMSIDESIKRFNSQFKATGIRAPSFNDALDNKYVEAKALKRPGIQVVKLTDIKGTPQQQADAVIRNMNSGFVVKDAKGDNGRNIWYSSDFKSAIDLAQNIQTAINNGRADDVYFETMVFARNGKDTFNEHRVHLYVDNKGKAHAFRNLTFNKDNTYYRADREALSGNSEYDTHILIPGDVNDPKIAALQDFAEKAMSGKGFSDMIFGLDVGEVQNIEGKEGNMIFEANGLTYGMSGWLGNPISMSEIISEMTGKPSVMAGLYELAKLSLSKEEIADVKSQIDQGMPAEYAAYPQYYDSINRGVALFNKYLPSGKWIDAMKAAFDMPKAFLNKLYAVISTVFKGSVDRRFEAQQRSSTIASFRSKAQSTEFDRQFPAHHGTPHSIIGRMTTDKIGTGENTLNEGWGLYATDTKEIAEWYRNTLSSNLFDGKPYDFNNPRHSSALAISNMGRENAIKFEKDQLNIYEDSLKFNEKRVAKALAELSKLKKETAEYTVQLKRVRAFQNFYDRVRKDIQSREKIINIIENNKESKIDKSGGSVVTIDIAPNKDNFLDWNKDIINQSEYVKERAKLILESIPKQDRVEIYSILDIGNHPVDWSDVKFWSGKRFYGFLAELAIEGRLPTDGINLGPEPASQNKFDSERVRYNKKHASLFLLKHGIPGNRYLDGDSFASKKEETSYNYVVFDDQLITILEREEQERFAQAQSTEKLTQKKNAKLLIPDKETTLRQYVNQVISHPDVTKAQKAVLNYIKKNATKLHLDTVKVGRTNLGYNYYSTTSSKIGVMPSDINTRIATHEITHAVTSDLIQNNFNRIALLLGKDILDYEDPQGMHEIHQYIADSANEEAMLNKGVSKEFIDLSNTYYRFLQDLGFGGPDSQLGAGKVSYEYQNKNSKIPYGAVNLDEFVAEVLSKPAFQRKLAQLPPTKGNSRSMYSQIMQIISRIIGIPFSKGGSLLNQAINESLSLIKNNEIVKSSKIYSEREPDGTWIIRPSSPESEITNINGLPLLASEVSSETQANKALATTEAQKESVTLQAQIESLEARIKDLQSQSTELSPENQARMKSIEPTPANLPQMREVVIDDLNEKMAEEKPQSQYPMTEKRMEYINKLQTNKALALNSLGEWISDSRITDAQADILLDSIDYVMERTEDPENLSTANIRYLVNVLQSMSDGGPPIGFKHIAGKMFIERQVDKLNEVRNNGKKRVHIQGPIGDWRREILFGIFRGKLGSTVQQSSEIAYMGLSDSGQKFLRDLMGYYKDGVDIQNLEETAVKTDFYNTITTAFTNGMTQLQSKRIGAVARLTQYEKTKPDPQKQILSRLNQIESGLDVEMAYKKDDGELSNVALRQILGGANLALFPDAPTIISFLENQLTPAEKTVLDKIRAIGKTYMPVLQTVKAITKQTTLQDFENYVHDLNVTPNEEASEQSMLKAFTSMADILHDRKGIKSSDKTTFAELDITAIADKQIKSSTYEKHTGMQRYMLANSLAAGSPLTDLLDADTNNIKQPVTNRLRSLLASYHNAMTTSQHQFTGIMGFIDASVNAYVGTKIVGINAFIKNSVSSTVARMSLRALGPDALKDSMTYDTHRAEINQYLKANYPTQYNRAGEYDIIEGQHDRYSWKSKVKRNIDIGHSGIFSILKTFPSLPRELVQKLNDTVLSSLSNVSNGLPEKYSAHAIWTSAYVHYMKQNGTVRDMNDFLARKPIDKRAANDASDFVSGALGYSADKANKGTYWNGSTPVKKIVSKAFSVFRQQSTGLNIEFQNNMQKTVRLLASGNAKEASASFKLATTSLANSISFRGLTIALSGSMLWDNFLNLDRFFNAPDEEEKKKKLMEAKRKYTENANRNNMRDFLSESLLMLAPIATSAMFIETAVAGSLDKANVVIGFTSKGFEIDKKEDIRIEIDKIKMQIAALEKAARTKTNFGKSTAAEDDEIEKLDIIKSQLTEKYKFKYFPSQSDKAMLSVFGSYGIAEEFINETIDSMIGDDIDTEQKSRLKQAMSNEFSYRDPIAGVGYGLDQVNNLMGYARALVPGKVTPDEASMPNSLFWMKYMKLGQNPQVVIERARKALAEDAVRKSIAAEAKALRIEKRWADKYRD